MSKAADLLSRLLVASKGVNTVERQAEARIKTNDYLARDKKELKGDGVLAIIQETEVELKALLAAAGTAGETNLVEVYEAALSVFATWTTAKDAA